MHWQHVCGEFSWIRLMPLFWIDLVNTFASSLHLILTRTHRGDLKNNASTWAAVVMCMRRRERASTGCPFENRPDEVCQPKFTIVCLTPWLYVVSSGRMSPAKYNTYSLSVVTCHTMTFSYISCCRCTLSYYLGLDKDWVTWMQVQW